MTTYAEAIAAKRDEREKISAEIEALRDRRNALSAEILALEQAITPPKKAKANPGDVVMAVEPAVTNMSPGARKEG